MGWKRLVWVVMALMMMVPAVATAKNKPKRKKNKTKKEETIKWAFVPYKQFQVEDLVGNLSSCIYRVTKDGDKIVLNDEDRIQVTCIRKGEKVTIEVRVNDKHLPKFSEEMLRLGLESAITGCFTRITEEDEPLVH